MERILFHRLPVQSNNESILVINFQIANICCCYNMCHWDGFFLQLQKLKQVRQDNLHWWRRVQGVLPNVGILYSSFSHICWTVAPTNLDFIFFTPLFSLIRPTHCIPMLSVDITLATGFHQDWRGAVWAAQRQSIDSRIWIVLSDTWTLKKKLGQWSGPPSLYKGNVWAYTREWANETIQLHVWINGN